MVSVQAPQNPDPATLSARLPAFAWRPVTAVAALTAAYLLATSARYGYHRDELYFLEAGRHLAWGYDDQPPLTPLLMRGETALFGTAVAAVRIVPLLCSLGMVYLAAACARELRGTRAAQVIAAAATAATPMALFLGHIFVTATVDFLVWSVILWLVLRWLRTRQDRLWPVIGAVAGLGLLNNNLVAGLAAILVIGALISGPRELFANRWVWSAAAIAVLLWLPYLIWQGQHGWPEAKMMGHISGQSDERANLLPFQLEAATGATPIWIAGLWRLLRGAQTRPYRMLAWAYPLLLALLAITGGKRYYPDGFLPLLFGAGSVAVVDWLRRGRERVRAAWLWASVALTAVTTALLVTPALPVRTFVAWGFININKENGETIGWPSLVATTAGAYATIPPQQRPRAVILAENYGDAGALAHFGPGAGLPFAYAPHDGYQRFGVPTDAQDGPVVAVGFRGDQAPDFLTGCVQAGVVDNGLKADNQEQGVPIWVCSGPHQPWSRLWPTLVHYS
ncbi:MAG: hypothetical protein HOW97_25865 [Catenulispora sp.]|nr:hypothetical protein [Catenulispora sp.]